MTSFVKKDEIKSNWILIDAKNAVVGRLAAYISKVLRGKNKSQYTPHMDNGDFIVITNIEKIKFTGSKFKNKNQYTPHMDHGDFVVVTNIEKIKFSGKKIDKKKYYRHTGHPGGIKFTTPNLLIKNKPEQILKLAVKRMLPGGPLAKKQLSKLKIYKGDNHPHESQNPTIVDFSKMNSKNYISIN